MKTRLLNSSCASVLKRVENGFSVMLLKHENQMLRGINDATEERPGEDALSQWPFSSQEKSSHQELNQLAP